MPCHHLILTFSWTETITWSHLQTNTGTFPTLQVPASQRKGEGTKATSWSQCRVWPGRPVLRARARQQRAPPQRQARSLRCRPGIHEREPSRFLLCHNHESHTCSPAPSPWPPRPSSSLPPGAVPDQPPRPTEGHVHCEHGSVFHPRSGRSERTPSWCFSDGDGRQAVGDIKVK